MKVKRAFIERVITEGIVNTRSYTYFCDGRVGCESLVPVMQHFNFPRVYVVWRVRLDFVYGNDRPEVEVVGLYNSYGLNVKCSNTDEKNEV